MSLTPAPGMVVGGRYQLQRPLGRGGMGAVWAAKNTATHRTVALKFLRGPAHTRVELRRRLLREARAATAVSHPNVVEVLDLFEHDEETPVMVMELLNGETLRNRLSRQDSLEIAETANLLLPVISAVGTAHACGIVHRDLKPENIFLDRSERHGERVFVLDFGIAKLLRAHERADEKALVTDTGFTLGTPCYMAPEQATAERNIDHRVDVWALGVMLYECLTGMRPIEGDSVGQVLMGLMTTGITPIERVLPDVPPDIASLVAGMLARDLSHRAADLHGAFDVLSAHATIGAPKFGLANSETGMSLDVQAAEDREDLADAHAPIASNHRNATDDKQAPGRPSVRWLLGLGAAALISVMFVVASRAPDSRAVDHPLASPPQPSHAAPAAATPIAMTALDSVGSSSVSEVTTDAGPIAASANGPKGPPKRARPMASAPSSTPVSSGTARDIAAAPSASAHTPRSPGGLEETLPF